MASTGDSSVTNHSLPRYILSEILTIFHGLVGGIKYGAKIRIPHAAAMALVFKRHESFDKNLKLILQSALEHAKSLGTFAAIYKALILALKIINFRRTTLLLDHSKAGYPAKPFHALVAGAVGGYLVWGDYTSINNQILLYISSRVFVGLLKLCTEKTNRTSLVSERSDVGLHDIEKSSTYNRFNLYPFVSAIVWGTAMYLFEEVPHVLQPSLKASMDEIYRLG